MARIWWSKHVEAHNKLKTRICALSWLITKVIPNAVHTGLLLKQINRK